ncbi:MAG TPA: hypothetical protein VI731_06035 [Bacteroidia bacterium]|nr:hypothetical protein [Bacteroidia bacterium]
MFFFAVPVFGQDSTVNKTPHGFIDLNGYYDTREFSTFTINLLANFNPRLQYFSLNNFDSGKHSTDLSSMYMEHHLRWNFHKKLPLDLAQNLTVMSGSGNDNLKYGLRWRWNQTPRLQNLLDKLHLMYFVNFHLVQFAEGTAPKGFTQIEHVYRLQVIPGWFKDRVYIFGFADQDIIWRNGGASFRWVTETQLGIRLAGQFYLVAEYRFNQYLNEKNGVGFGLEYIINY